MQSEARQSGISQGPYSAARRFVNPDPFLALRIQPDPSPTSLFLSLPLSFSPFLPHSGETKLEACVFCDETLSEAVKVRHAATRHPMHKRGRGRGRGRGGGRARGRGRKGDKMSQLDQYFV
jgi:hypothetical protein